MQALSRQNLTAASMDNLARVCSRADSYYVMLNTTEDPTNATEDEIPLNSLVHSVCKIICNVMVSTVEAEVGALYINARKGGKLRVALNEMGHKQPPPL
eukprot:9035395-Ditylum_brightwellii.AAC.1